MAQKKLSQIQIGFIILLWVFIVAFILYSAKITVTTIASIIISGIIIFIPIYKSLRK
ncbi:MAG TPA: hypothetical protein VLZ33_05225 [Dysgonamonadaceae bacterium]|nr:hypothetical protein [Dysgonamonadaceae bacterium]